jgi:hypothetical protein
MTLSNLKNLFASGLEYSNNGAAWGVYKMTTYVGNQMAPFNSGCESAWDEFWDEVSTITTTLINVDKFICKWSWAIEIGTAVVGAPEAGEFIADTACAI